MAEALLMKNELSFKKTGSINGQNIGRKSLPDEIDVFLAKCDGEDRIREAISGTRNRVHVITERAGDFESAVKDLDKAGIPISADNRRRLKKLREYMGEDFVNPLAGHYEMLEKEISAIIRKIQTEGMDYIMNGPKGYNEKIAGNLDAILKRMTFGYRVLSNNILEGKSRDYAKIKIDTGRTRAETERISDIFRMLTNDDSIYEIKKRMLELIKNSLHYMHDDIAGQAGLVIYELPTGTQRRGLDMLRDGVFQQLEFLLNLVTRSVYVARDINMQRTLLLGKDMAEDITPGEEKLSA